MKTFNEFTNNDEYEDITESVEHLASSLQKLTNNNNHVDALLLLAKSTKEHKFITIFKALSEIKKADGGSFSNKGSDLVDEYRSLLLKRVKAKLPKEQYVLIHNTF